MVAGGIWYWLSTRNFVTTDDAFVDSYTTQVAPRVAGQVTKLLFADNDHVAAGQTLLLIDPRDYQAKLDQAKAQQASAQASVTQAAGAGFRAAGQHRPGSGQRASGGSRHCCRLGRITIATSTSPQARLAASRSRRQLRRSTPPRRSSTPTARWLAVHRRRRGPRRRRCLRHRRRCSRPRQTPRRRNCNLSYCTIVAPEAGLVTHRTVSAGNYVNAGQALFALVQDDRWVTANFKETQLAAIRPGQDVDLVIDAVPSITFHGKVDSFQGGTGTAFSVLPAENATGNYVKIVQRLPVKIVFDDPRLKDYKLAPGMSVTPSVRVR